MYKFSVCNNHIKLHRYKVQVENCKDMCFIDSIKMRKYIDSLDCETIYKVEELHLPELEWLEDISVEGCIDPYARAIEIYENGEKAYKQELEKHKNEENLIISLAQAVFDLQYQNAVNQINQK